MSKNKKILIGIIVIAMILGLGYYLTKENVDEPISHQEVVQLKAGYLKHPGYLPLFCAEELGLLNSENLNIELVPFESSPAITSAFNSGEIQIAPMATSSALSLESLQPGTFKVFALSSETPEDYLTSIVISKELSETVKSVEDLKGKTLGVFPGPAAYTLFTLVFKSYGLEVGTDVFLQVLGPPLQVQALASAQVDGLATYEPFGTQAEIQIGAIKLLPGAVEQKVLTPTQGGSWLLSTSVINETPSVVTEIVQIMDKSISYIEENRELLPTTIAKYAAVDIEVAKVAPIVKYSLVGNEIDLEAYQTHSDIMLENQVISKEIQVKNFLLDINEYK